MAVVSPVLLPAAASPRRPRRWRSWGAGRRAPRVRFRHAPSPHPAHAGNDHGVESVSRRSSRWRRPPAIPWRAWPAGDRSRDGGLSVAGDRQDGRPVSGRRSRHPSAW